MLLQNPAIRSLWNHKLFTAITHCSLSCTEFVYGGDSVSCVILSHLHGLSFSVSFVCCCMFLMCSFELFGILSFIWKIELKLYVATGDTNLASDDDNDDDDGNKKQNDIGDALTDEVSFAEVMVVLTVRKCFYLKWCSLCLAGINCSLIRYRWDLWEEGLFSLCQVASHACVSACIDLATASKTHSTTC